MNITKNSNIKKLVLSALFLSLGIVLPIFTAQIKEIGDSLLPMHLAVMLCAFLCGKYSLFVGFCLPFLRSFLFGMPPIYPNAVYMALELFTYALVICILQKALKINGIAKIYISLISAQILGRVVWGVSKAVLLGFAGKVFTFSAFVIGGFADALLGIILQLILIPLIVLLVEKVQKTN